MFARTLFCFPKIHTLDSNIFTSVMNSIVLQFKEKVDDKSNFLEKEERVADFLTIYYYLTSRPWTGC